MEENFIGLCKLNDLNLIILRRLFLLINENVSFVFEKNLHEKIISFIKIYCDHELNVIDNESLGDQISSKILIYYLGNYISHLKGSLTTFLSNIFIFIHNKIVLDAEKDNLAKYNNFYNSLSRIILSSMKSLLERLLEKVASDKLSTDNLFENLASKSVIMTMSLLIVL